MYQGPGGRACGRPWAGGAGAGAPLAPTIRALSSAQTTSVCPADSALMTAR